MSLKPIDRWLWFAILLLPWIGWSLFEPDLAPTVIEKVKTGEKQSTSLPIVREPSREPGREPDREPTQTSAPIDDSSTATGIGKPLQLQIRALAANGDLMPVGTVLPLEGSQGPLVVGSDGLLKISGAGLQWRTGSGSLEPINFVPGQWVVDCTFQEVSESAPVQIPWVILARHEDPQLPAHLMISGETRLPPGARLVVQLLDHENVLDGGILTTVGPQIWWDRLLISRDWFATLLTLRFEWRVSAATPIVAEKVAEIRPPVSAGQDWVWTGVCGVDDQEEAQRQSDQIASWYSQAMREVETCRDLLLMAGAKARGKRSTVMKDDDRVDRMIDHPLFSLVDRLGRGRAFDFKLWRRLLDEEFPQRWQGWADPTAVPWPDRYPGAAKNIGLLFQTLSKYARLESTVVYKQLGKPRHVHDFVADFDWDPATERTQTLSKIRNFVTAISERVTR